MNNITVNVELCAEDRARLDKIISLLETRSAQAQVDLEAKYGKQDESKVSEFIAKTLAEDTVTQMAREALEGSKTAQDEPKVPDHPTLDPFPEVSTVTEEEEPTKAEPTISATDLQQLVIALCRAGKKDKVREVISTYGVATVAAVPEGKRTEVFRKLKMLEG